MKSKIKLLLTLLFFTVAIFYSNTYAREECKDGFIKGSYCPCPDVNGDGQADAEYASVCGIVTSSNYTIAQDSSSRSGRTVTSYKEPVSGVTVGIYELDGDAPTGLRFGGIGGGADGEDMGLGRLVGSCSTSENEGKYHCLTKRVAPGNKAFAIFYCGNKKAYTKILPTPSGYINFNAEVECSGEYEYVEPPKSVEIGERDKFLSCSIDADDPAIGYGDDPDDKQIVHQSANVGVEGGDIRFTKFDGFDLGILGNFGSHPGAFIPEDCVARYKFLNDTNKSWLSVGPFGLEKYGSVEEKCNLDGALSEEEKMLDPFRYSIPEKDRQPSYRTFEHRFAVQRELQDPKAFAQYLGIMFGNCISEVYLKYHGEENTDEPIPCGELEMCMDTNSYSNKNLYTTASFGSTLTTKADFVDLLKNVERDPSDIVCRHSEFGDITVGEVQPQFPDDPCTPGAPDCKYKIPYMPPQFYIFAGKSVEIENTVETNNDTYGTGVRTEDWKLGESETENPHKGGHKTIFSDESVHKNNSGTSALRVATDEVVESDTGVLVNKFMNYADALGGDYDYGDTYSVGDVGNDVRSLCLLSSVNGVGDYTVVDENTDEYKVNNEFIGNRSDHIGSEIAATATYANSISAKKDELLGETGSPKKAAYDYFDTLLRLASGEGKLEEIRPNLIDLIGSVAERGSDKVLKSFGKRTTKESWDYDKDAIVNVDYCISVESYKKVLPVYKEDGSTDYPGDAGKCYPWIDLESCQPNCRRPDKKHYCAVGPGVGQDPEGKLRSCKVNECVKEWIFNEICTNEVCTPIIDPINDVPTGREDCVCAETTIEKIAVPCSKSDITVCLKRQLDNFPENPIEGDDNGNPFCDLSRAGPMGIAGDINKDHMARVVQEPMNPEIEEEINANPLNDTTNYTGAAFINKVEMANQTKYEKVKFVDYATTEDQDPTSSDGLTHALTAGAMTEGVGTGASEKMRSVVTRKEGPSFLTDTFPSFRWSDECANYGKNSPNGWCKPVKAPAELDIHRLDYGACRPHITGSCPLVGEGIGSLALDIVGAAGNYAGGNDGSVPGSLLLAIIVSEQEWLYWKDANGNDLPLLMNWDNASIESYSDPWFAKIPTCNDKNFTAQGPYGFTSYDTGNTFESAVRRSTTGYPGYHPSRAANDNDAVKVVNQCNFLDASYAEANMIYKDGLDCSLKLTEDQARAAIASHRGPTATPESVPQIYVDIALNCQ